MDQIQKQSGLAAAEHPGSHYTQNKSRAAVVAEGQHTFRLGPGALAIFIDLDGGSGPHRVASHKAQGQGGGAAAVYPKERGHHRLQKPPQVS